MADPCGIAITLLVVSGLTLAITAPYRYRVIRRAVRELLGARGEETLHWNVPGTFLLAAAVGVVGALLFILRAGC